MNKKPYILINDDVLNVVDNLPEADIILTDPPYGVTYQSNQNSGRGVLPITNDGTRLSLKLYRRLAPQLKANHILWFTRWDAWPDVWEIIGQYFQSRGLLVWDKGTPGMGDLSHWGPSYELIGSFGKAKINGKRDGSILQFSGVPNSKRLHPTEKPVELLQYLIEKITQPGDIVFDPFMGSGSTGEACAKTGRRFIGIEVKKDYFNMATKRIKDSYKQPRLFCSNGKLDSGEEIQASLEF